IEGRSGRNLSEYCGGESHCEDDQANGADHVRHYNPRMQIPIALTVAGADSSGGAGIQADIKTFARLKVHGISVITALTAQDTAGVQEVFPVAAEFVGRQLESVCIDMPPGAMKTGMLHSAGTVEAAADAIRRFAITNVVLDPVIASTSGTPLLD